MLLVSSRSLQGYKNRVIDSFMGIHSCLKNNKIPASLKTKLMVQQSIRYVKHLGCILIPLLFVGVGRISGFPAWIPGSSGDGRRAYREKAIINSARDDTPTRTQITARLTSPSPFCLHSDVIRTLQSTYNRGLTLFHRLRLTRIGQGGNGDYNVGLW